MLKVVQHLAWGLLQQRTTHHVIGATILFTTRLPTISERSDDSDDTDPDILSGISFAHRFLTVYPTYVIDRSSIV